MQKKKGISLIVLVITIIVMIILASTIIISLNNNGIINNAQSAVDKTNEKQVQELASMAWGEAYVDYLAMTETEKEEVGSLKEYATDKIKESLKANNLKPLDYGMEVTDSGVTIAKGWLQTSDRKVVKGKTILEIGDVVNYHDAANEDGTDKYTGSWQILGAKDGTLLIMTVDDTIITTNMLYGSKEYYANYIDSLNELCKPYGTGKGAKKARSITIEDLDRVTGFDKNSNKYFGEKVTLYWDTTEENRKHPYYEITNGEKGNLSGEHSKFIWYDGISWQESSMPTTLPATKQKICTITLDSYSYTSERVNLDKNSKAYKMLFGNNNKYYALANCHNNLWADKHGGRLYIGYSFQVVNYSGVSILGNIDSYNYEYLEEEEIGVCAVVELLPDITLTNTSNGWNII